MSTSRALEKCRDLVYVVTKTTEMYLLHFCKTRLLKFLVKNTIRHNIPRKDLPLIFTSNKHQATLMGGVKVLKTYNLWVVPFYYHSKCKIHRNSLAVQFYGPFVCLIYAKKILFQLHIKRFTIYCGFCIVFELCWYLTLFGTR